MQKASGVRQTFFVGITGRRDARRFDFSSRSQPVLRFWSNIRKQKDVKREKTRQSGRRKPAHASHSKNPAPRRHRGSLDDFFFLSLLSPEGLTKISSKTQICCCCCDRAVMHLACFLVGYQWRLVPHLPQEKKNKSLVVLLAFSA